MGSRIDFQLHEVLPDGRVIGRNCREDAPLGTVFTALCRRVFPAAKPGEAIESPKPIFVSGISLRLDAVECYGRSIECVHSGLTAALSLSGSGFDSVVKAISTATERTYFSLCTFYAPILMNDVALNLVVLRSPDMPRAAAFYSRLGLQFTRHQHGNGPEHFAAELSGGVFELYPLSPGGPSTLGTRIGFSVPSLDAAIAALAEYPGAIISPPKDSEWGRRAVVTDPDGHRVELLQR